MKFNYCPQCGKEGTVKRENQTDYRCRSCQWRFWNNPRAAMGTIFVNDKGELLFSKRARDPGKGEYDFPGGFLDYREDAFAATVREIHEETGVDIDIDDIRLLTAYTVEYMPGVSSLDLIMVVKRWKGNFLAADDVAALEWKPSSFLTDPLFRPDYPGLEEKITAYLSA